MSYTIKTFLDSTKYGKIYPSSEINVDTFIDDITIR